MGLSSPTVLITGGAGFIGSYLAKQLLEDGWQVRILDDMSTGSRDNLDAIADHPSLEIRSGTIAEAGLVARLAGGADVIVHLAAAVGVQLVIEQPVRTIESNVGGTENVLHAAEASRSRVIVASTSEVYGKGSKYPFAETDDVVLGPTSKSRWAYAASKMIDEFLCFAHHEEFGLDAVPIRLFNTVGARQTGRYGMVVPRLVRQALRGEDVTVYGDGSQQRCFCDVRDVVRAIVGLCEHQEAPVQTYNIGNTEEVTILELAERVVVAAGSRSEIVRLPYGDVYPPGFEDMQRRVPDTTRIRELLGWEPEHDLDDIIRSVVDYERSKLGEVTT